MEKSLPELNALIKKEADEILFKRGLWNILSSFGSPQISGSYALDLMTWRDLDIYLETENITMVDFFELGSKICNVFKPIKMSYRNELVAKTEGLPYGIYWGIYLGNERTGSWKIDIWAVDSKEFLKLSRYCNDIKAALTPTTRSLILDIKSQCWQNPEYRRSFGSLDIYKAVIENNVTNFEGFRNYLKLNKVR